MLTLAAYVRADKDTLYTFAFVFLVFEIQLQRDNTLTECCCYSFMNAALTGENAKFSPAVLSYTIIGLSLFGVVKQIVNCSSNSIHFFIFLHQTKLN